MASSSRHGRRLVNFVVLATGIAVLAACSASSTKVASKSPVRSKEYFAESEYGVKASPRVSSLASNLPRGGGRNQIGRPYQIRGQWYHPKEVPGYKSTGLASWYGDAFHGRLTANGEVYDMTHLTAAHPTMPLPSYARVTNKTNGHSVIVRVNDRGPFARGRVIDLSKRAAEMLDYKNSGVAQVQVEYVGRAPLHGQDEQYLLASYKPNGTAPDPSDGMPGGVMIAMNGTTPTLAAAPVPAAPFPGELRSSSTISNIILPESMPPLPRRPGADVAVLADASMALSYADQRVSQAAAISSFSAHQLEPSAIAASWGRQNPVQSAASAHIAVGTFASLDEAQLQAKHFIADGEARIEADPQGRWFGLTVHTDGRAGLDDLLQRAWASGAGDAMIVRD